MTFTLSPDDIKRCREISTGNRKLIMAIVKLVSKHTGIPVPYIMGVRKSRSVAHARWLAFYLAHDVQGFTLEEIGKAMNRDHTTVLHGVRMERERRKAKMMLGQAPVSNLSVAQNTDVE